MPHMVMDSVTSQHASASSCDTNAGDALGGAAVEKLALLGDDAPAAVAIERRIVEIASDVLDQLAPACSATRTASCRVMFT